MGSLVRRPNLGHSAPSCTAPPTGARPGRTRPPPRRSRKGQDGKPQPQADLGARSRRRDSPGGSGPAPCPAGCSAPTTAADWELVRRPVGPARAAASGSAAARRCPASTRSASIRATAAASPRRLLRRRLAQRRRRRKLGAAAQRACSPSTCRRSGATTPPSRTRTAWCSAPTTPDHLWCQHHNGVFRSDDGAQNWTSLDVPPSVFGFAVAVHPATATRPGSCPRSRTSCRVRVDGKLVVTRTRDGGKTFECCATACRSEHAYDLVYRHGLTIDATGDRLAFGSTTGGLWVSRTRATLARRQARCRRSTR